MRSFLFGLSICILNACSSTQVKGPPDEACTFETHQGMCGLVVIVDPRESEAPYEATSLTLHWTWKGNAPPQVKPLVKQWNMTATQAYQLASTYSEVDEARCIVRHAIAPTECLGRAKIIHIEGQTL